MNPLHLLMKSCSFEGAKADERLTKYGGCHFTSFKFLQSILCFEIRNMPCNMEKGKHQCFWVLTSASGKKN